jgi:hypothetical protein
MRAASLSARLAKEPKDAKAKSELDNIQAQIEAARKKAGLYIGGGAAAAPAKKYEGFSGTRVN